MTNEKDFLRNVGIAAIGAVPYVGGPISFLLDKYVPEENKRRQNELISKLGEDIEKLKEKIDVKNMDTPEFKSIFMKLFSESIFEHRKEKIDSFRNILLNTLIDESGLSFDKAEFYARLVIDLIPDEIKILNVFYQLDVKQTAIEDRNNKRDIYIMLMDMFNETNREYIEALVHDCMRYNLISGSPKQKAKYGREGIFITDLGRDFVEYIFSPVEVSFFDRRK